MSLQIYHFHIQLKLLNNERKKIMKGTEFYGMINDEINKLNDEKNSLIDVYEKYLINKGISSLLRLRKEFFPFIECENER